MLDENRIRSAVGERPFRWYAKIGSTNAEALDWLRDGAPTGALVLADEQLQGRGRHGRDWHTPAGAALAVSLILRPAMEELPQMTMLGALAIAELTSAAGARDVTLKWPNDVQAEGRKLAGVLTEAVWQGGQLRGAVLGMGLNVRVDFRGSVLEGQATSLETVCGRRLERAQLLARLLQRLEHWLGQSDRESLYLAWRARLRLPTEPVQINGLCGVPEGVAPDGALMLRDAAGALHQLHSGELLPESQESDGR